MRYKLTDVLVLGRTSLGRMELKESLYQSCWPVLGPLAALYRRSFASRARLIAVVGSLGKTTTLRAVMQVLGILERKTSCRNSWSHVSAAVFRIRPSTPYAAVEAGISGPGQMRVYARLLRPDIVIVTSIASEHLRSFGSAEALRREKARMVRQLPQDGVAILNGDDPHVRWMAQETKSRVLTFGLEGTNDIHAGDIALDWPGGTRFKLHVLGEERQVRVKLFGPHMLYPVLAAVAVAHTAGLNLDEALARLAALTPTPGRMEVVALANGVYLLRDDFKSALETVHSAFDVFSMIPAPRKIVVLGDVSEPPGSQGGIYGKIGERLAQTASFSIIIGSGYQRYAAGASRAGFPRHLLFKAGRDVLAAARELKKKILPGDVVLIKGRDTQRLDRISLVLQGRDVKCAVAFCDARSLRCDRCPMLEKDGNGLSWRPLKQGGPLVDRNA